MYQKQEKCNDIKKYNILKILKNIGAIFTGAYLHHIEVPKKVIVERNIEESVNLRRRGIVEIEKEEKNINNELFKKYFTDYRNPSAMYKNLRETEGKKMRIKQIY